MNDLFASPLLTAEEQEKFRSEMLWELSRMIAKYNRGSGSSIRTEKAESILQSMLYCVSVYLGSVPDAAAEVRNTPGAELFRRGLAAVKDLVRESGRLYRGVLDTRIPTDLAVYNGTLDLGIPAFLRSYDPEFDAHEASALGLALDYPLQKPVGNLSGVLYLRAYLEEMKRENEFCAGYRKNYIRSVLLLHGRRHRLNYREMIVNIPELLLAAQEKSGAEASPGML